LAQASLPATFEGISDHSIQRGVSAIQPAMSHRAKFVGHAFVIWLRRSCFATNGTYILENMDTAALAADKAYEFLFVLGQPRWRGGVQAMINPIAIR
jgi:hypothetical protein